jgi:hypothetical protein
MSITKKLRDLGFAVVARTAPEPTQVWPKIGVVPLVPNERLSIDVNAALNKAADFELQCDWDRQIEANYSYITPRSPRVISICKATGFGEFESEPGKHDDLYAHGLTLQIDIGYDDGEWEDANSNIIQYEEAKSYTGIPVALHLDGQRVLVTKLDKIDDLPDWIAERIQQINAILYRKFSELAKQHRSRHGVR